MASSKAPLTFQVKGYPFVGQELTLADHSSSIPNSISQDVLFALPYIGLLVGIDELTPSNAVYGIYDSSHHGLRFVRGDGIFIPQHQVCFLKLFNDGSSQHSSQRAYFRELVRRSAIHCYSTKNARFAADCRNTFPTLGMIKSTLLYVGDLKFGSCPALESCKNDECGDAWETPPPEYFPIASAPQWNFDPNGFQASVSGDCHDFDVKYLQFCTKYRHLNISPLDFQHAAFCLVGLEMAGLISFSFVGTNNVKYFKNGLTPPMAPKLVTPLKSYQNWTVDCFLARFNKYQRTFQIGDDPIYERFPNPVLWLEAKMEYEEATGKISIPRKIQPTDKGSYTDDSIISWEFLRGLKWETRGQFSAYPKPFVPLNQQPLRLHDIIDEKTFKFKESDRAKKERREKKKAAKRAEKEKPIVSYVFDLTNGISNKDHMHGTPIRNHRDLYEEPNRRSFNSNSAASSLAMPASTRKRRLEEDLPQSTFRLSSAVGASSSRLDDDDDDGDDEEFPPLEEVVAKHSKPSGYHTSTPRCKKEHKSRHERQFH